MPSIHFIGLLQHVRVLLQVTDPRICSCTKLTAAFLLY